MGYLASGLHGHTAISIEKVNISVIVRSFCVDEVIDSRYAKTVLLTPLYITAQAPFFIPQTVINNNKESFSESRPNK